MCEISSEANISLFTKALIFTCNVHNQKMVYGIYIWYKARKMK